MAYKLKTSTPNEKIHPLAKYKREDKERFALSYLLNGEVTAAAKECGVPRTTAQKWMQKAWWPKLCEVIRLRHKEVLEAKWENVLEKSTIQLLDRIDNGDTIIYKGKQVKVPVKAKELATVLDTTHANLRTSRNQPNTISVSATLDLRQLASNFARAGRTYQYELNGKEKKEPDKLPYFGEVGAPDDNIDDEEDVIDVELEDDGEEDDNGN